METKHPCIVKFPRNIYRVLPLFNSDQGVEITFRRTPRGAVVEDAQVVVASMSSYLSGPYGQDENTVLVGTPRWEGEGPSRAQYRAVWRELIVEAIKEKLQHKS
ncbi:MAG: hypothetical protein JRI66_10710 [Deltaproteobacteria bacterium]|nr:hypothetical protein [Deltaproteobacteria bacterium]